MGGHLREASGSLVNALVKKSSLEDRKPVTPPCADKIDDSQVERQ